MELRSEDIRAELKIIRAQAAKTDQEAQNQQKQANGNNETTTMIEESTEWNTQAQGAINLKLVHNREEFEDNKSVFHPTYAHQIFEDERILGYKNIKANFFFSAASMKPYLSVTFDEKQHDSATDVQSALKKLLPTTVEPFVNSDEFIKYAESEQQGFQPPGKLLKTYTLSSENSEDKVFEIRKGTLDDDAVLNYHARLELFLLFFIDASSYIDKTDPAWDIYFFFQKETKHGETVYTFMGYTTVFKFYAYPDKIRKRISQVLILPPFQRQGHGFHILNGIYEDSRVSNVRDITVEDPSDDFAFLRDLVDCTLLQKHNFFQERPLKVLIEEQIQEIQAKLKLYRQQIKHCYDIFLYRDTDKKDENEYKEFRLGIKRQIYKEYQEVLSAIEDKTARFEELDKIYKDLEKTWDLIIEKLEKITPM